MAAMERLYSILTDDAVERGLMRDDFYFLSDELLASFKRMQGYDPTTYFPGSRIEQAYLISAEGDLGMRRAMAEANGVPMANQPLLPCGLYLVRPESAGRPRESIIVQTTCRVPSRRSNKSAVLARKRQPAKERS